MPRTGLRDGSSAPLNLFDHYGVKVMGFDALFAEAEETLAERLLEKLLQSDLVEFERGHPLFESDLNEFNHC